MKTVNQKINEFLTKEVHRLEKRVADLHEKELMAERSNYIKLRTRVLDYAHEHLPSWDVERIKSIVETIENSRKEI